MEINFLKALKWFLEDIHEANVELITGIGDVFKETRNEIKEDIKKHNESIGNAIEKIDRATQAGKNFIDGINPIKFIKREFNSEPELQLADHLCVQRIGYTHHGLYIGNGYVLHYSDGYIKSDSLDDFQGVSTINVVNSTILYSKDTVVSRGYSKLGQGNYNVAFNNCEHFVTWCRSGGKTSDTI